MKTITAIVIFVVTMTGTNTFALSPVYPPEEPVTVNPAELLTRSTTDKYLPDLRFSLTAWIRNFYQHHYKEDEFRPNVDVNRYAESVAGMKGGAKIYNKTKSSQIDINKEGWGSFAVYSLEDSGTSFQRVKDCQKLADRFLVDIPHDRTHDIALKADNLFYWFVYQEPAALLQARPNIYRMRGALRHILGKLENGTYDTLAEKENLISLRDATVKKLIALHQHHDSLILQYPPTGWGPRSSFAVLASDYFSPTCYSKPEPVVAIGPLPDEPVCSSIPSETSQPECYIPTTN
jgi:hypothetical protein